MTIWQKLKWPLIILLMGYLIRTIGALLKIRHWPMADEFLTIGIIIICLGLAAAIIVLARTRKDGAR